MNEPWIDNPGLVGGIIGGIIGLLGAIIGTLVGVFISRGKAKKLTLSVVTFAFVLSFISIIVGIVAILSGQPYAVWECFGETGILGTVIFGIGFWVIRKRIAVVEHRKLQSEDLTLEVYKDDKAI